MGFILLIMVALTFFSALTQQKLLEEQMTYQEFMVAIENKSVKMVQIEQNPQTPTGNLIVATTDGEYHDMAVSDVLEIQELLRANGIDYRLEDVPQENYLITVILPVGLCLLVVIVLLSVMNARASGGGNAKMMNFGKSRARMTKTNNINFEYLDIKF